MWTFYDQSFLSGEQYLNGIWLQKDEIKLCVQSTNFNILSSVEVRV